MGSQGISTALRALVTLSIAVVSLIIVTPLSMPIATMMTGIYFAITFIAPGVLVWAQKYKKYVISTVSDRFLSLTPVMLQ